MLWIHNLYGGAPAKWKSMAGLKLLLNMWPEAALGLVASTFPAGRRQVRPGHSHFDWQRISIVLVFLFLVWLDNERCQSYQYVTAADLFTRSQHVTSSVRPGNGSLSSTRGKFRYFPTAGVLNTSIAIYRSIAKVTWVDRMASRKKSNPI